MTLSLILAATGLIQISVPEGCPAREPSFIGDPLTILSFESGSARLSPSARRNLDSWRELIQRLRFPARIELTGNTDRVGTRQANLRLSARRARAVRDYLVSLGIPPESISILATGEDHLAVETADGIPEAQNRIVWFAMISDAREPRC